MIQTSCFWGGTIGKRIVKVLCDGRDFGFCEFYEKNGENEMNKNTEMISLKV